MIFFARVGADGVGPLSGGSGRVPPSNEAVPKIRRHVVYSKIIKHDRTACFLGAVSRVWKRAMDGRLIFSRSDPAATSVLRSRSQLPFGKLEI